MEACRIIARVPGAGARLTDGAGADERLDEGPHRALPQGQHRAKLHRIHYTADLPYRPALASTLRAFSGELWVYEVALCCWSECRDYNLSPCYNLFTYEKLFIKNIYNNKSFWDKYNKE